MKLHLTPDKIACIRDMQREVQEINEYLYGKDIAITLVPKMDLLMVGLQALLEPTHEEQKASEAAASDQNTDNEQTIDRVMQAIHEAYGQRMSGIPYSEAKTRPFLEAKLRLQAIAAIGTLAAGRR